VGRLLRVAVGLGVLAAVLGAAGLVGLFVYFGNDTRLPTVESLRDYRPKQVTRLLDRNGAVIAELGAEKRTFVPYAEIPKILIDAVVSAEDADYWHHDGLDYRGMLRAFIENVLRGRTAQGGSTITQQVVKTFLLSPERTLRRKVQEIILARRLSQKLSKEQILELYLNQIYYGHGRYGCEEAARFFFGKSVRQVNVAEAALLAGRRARSGCRRGSTPRRPRRGSGTCWGSSPSGATSIAPPPTSWPRSPSSSRATRRPRPSWRRRPSTACRAG
jgi:penicillin-binding protein 1A